MLTADPMAAWRCQLFCCRRPDIDPGRPNMMWRAGRARRARLPRGDIGPATDHRNLGSYVQPGSKELGWSCARSRTASRDNANAWNWIWWSVQRLWPPPGGRLVYFECSRKNRPHL